MVRNVGKVKGRVSRKPSARKAAAAKKTTPLAVETRRELSVFHDPFSKATQQPRIPDGKTGASLGIRNQAVRELVNKVTPVNTAASIMHIILYGGKAGGVFVYNCEPQQPGFLQPGNRLYRHMGYNDHAAIEATDLTLRSGPPTAADYPQEVIQKDSFVRWRIVSQGLILKLLNTDEEDDGWFEACRLTEPLDEDHFMVSTAEDGAGEALVSPSITMMTDGLAVRQLVEQRSYVSGRLKDIHKHQFNLNPCQTHSDFNRVAGLNKLDEPDLPIANYDLADQSWRFSQGSTDANRLIKQEIDQGQDMVYIRIHARKNQDTGNNNAGLARELNGSRLLAHLVSNQEIEFGTEDRESKFQRQTNMVSTMADHHAAKASNNNASGMVT